MPESFTIKTSAYKKSVSNKVVTKKQAQTHVDKIHESAPSMFLTVGNSKLTPIFAVSTKNSRMNWLQEAFLEPTMLQAVIVISLVSAVGLFLGRQKIFGISLGITFVFFAGILAGHFGIVVNKDMLNFAQSFGLILFVVFHIVVFRWVWWGDYSCGKLRPAGIAVPMLTPLIRLSLMWLEPAW